MTKLNEKQIKARIESYQKLYPGKPLFFTGDGNCFLEKSPCADHARKTNQTWFEVKTETEEPKETKTKGITEAEATAKVKELDLAGEVDYELAKEIVAALKLTAISKKKDDLLLAIEEYKNSLKTDE